MIKKFFIAAALVIASPAMVFSQGIFWSFSDTSAQNSATVNQGDSVTAYIFSDVSDFYSEIDLNFNSATAGALLFSGGTVANSEFNIIGGRKFDSSVLSIDPAATGVADNGNLSSVNVTQNGVSPLLGPLFDPDFNSNVGPNGAALLASVDFTAAVAGDQTLEFSLGPQGIQDILGQLRPSFGLGSVEVIAVPEPTSYVLLVLGSIGLIALRKRS